MRYGKKKDGEKIMQERKRYYKRETYSLALLGGLAIALIVLQIISLYGKFIYLSENFLVKIIRFMEDFNCFFLIISIFILLIIIIKRISYIEIKEDKITSGNLLYPLNFSSIEISNIKSVEMKWPSFFKSFFYGFGFEAPFFKRESYFLEGKNFSYEVNPNEVINISFFIESLLGKVQKDCYIDEKVYNDIEQWKKKEWKGNFILIFNYLIFFVLMIFGALNF